MLNKSFMSDLRDKGEKIKSAMDLNAAKVDAALNAVKKPSISIGFQAGLDKVLGDLRTLLIEKNTAYGNSALNPIRIFSKAQAHSQILVRIDDKLSRIRNFQGQEVGPSGDAAVEDTIQDLIGYLVLLKISQLRRT